MSLTSNERRQLGRLALRLHQGAVKHFRLWSSEVRHRGREAPMGLSKTGRISDYLPMLSYLRREVTYRYKEVSPTIDFVIVIELTDDEEFNHRICETAAAFGYMATTVGGGGAAVVRTQSLLRDYAPIVRDFGMFEASLDRLVRQSLPTGASVQSHERCASTLSELYEGTHVVYVGAYWEKAVITAIGQRLLSGVTFCVIESLTSAGARWWGDALPHALLRERLRDRYEQCAATCRRQRSNFFLIRRQTTVVRSLFDQLTRNAILH